MKRSFWLSAACVAPLALGAVAFASNNNNNHPSVPAPHISAPAPSFHPQAPNNFNGGFQARPQGNGFGYHSPTQPYGQRTTNYGQRPTGYGQQRTTPYGQHSNGYGQRTNSYGQHTSSYRQRTNGYGQRTTHGDSHATTFAHHGSRHESGKAGHGSGMFAKDKHERFNRPDLPTGRRDERGERVHDAGRERAIIAGHEHDFRGRSVRRFGKDDLVRWRGGRWRHDWYNGRWGWWYDVDGVWYPYASPYYPYPPFVASLDVEEAVPVGEVPPAVMIDGLQIPPAAYWCASASGFFPTVAVCPDGWKTFPAQ